MGERNCFFLVVVLCIVLVIAIPKMFKNLNDHEENMESLKGSQQRTENIHQENMERIKDEHIRTQEGVKDKASKFCMYCGQSIPYRALYCPHCGGNVGEENQYVEPDNYSTSAYSNQEKK